MTHSAHKYALLWACLFSLLFLLTEAHAHESHSNQIEQLESQLNHVTPARESMELLLKRADLHRRQSDWEAALSDYLLVAESEPDNIAMMLGRTQLFLDQHRYTSAVEWSNRVLRLRPTHAGANLRYARALAGLGDFSAAAIVFERGLNQIDKPRPEHYLEHAQMLLASTPHSNSASAAIATLDRGAETLGHPTSLHGKAYEIEQHSGHLDAALNRVDQVLERNDSLLNWRLRRGELLHKLGRSAEAMGEILCLIDKIEQLPEQRRRSHAFQVLLQRGRGLVERLKSLDGTATSLTVAAPIPEC